MILRLLFPAFLSLTLAADAVAADCIRADDQLKIVFEERYAAMTTATNARDANAISALLAPGFVSEDVSGNRMDATAMIDEVLAAPRYFKETSSTTLLSIRLAAPGAIVEHRHETEKLKKILAGMVTQLKSIALSTDEWVCQEGEWLWQRTTVDQLDLFLDGVHARMVREE